MYDRDALVEIVKTKALEFGNFTLASGKTTRYYLDCRRVTLDARGAYLIAVGMRQLLAALQPDAIGGMAVGAVPITAAILAQAGAENQSLRGFFVRKEAKEYGQGRQIEGPIQPGEKVVVVEDVVTTGGSSLQAIAHCEDFGLQVAGVLAVVDRLEGGREAFAAQGYSLQTLLTIRDLGID